MILKGTAKHKNYRTGKIYHHRVAKVVDTGQRKNLCSGFLINIGGIIFLTPRFCTKISALLAPLCRLLNRHAVTACVNGKYVFQGKDYILEPGDIVRSTVKNRRFKTTTNLTAS